MALTNPVITEKLISQEKPKTQNDQDSILLTSIDDIRVLLKNINNKHSLLSVIIPPYDEYFGSTIIEINNDENYLVIDELYPKEGHDRIKVGTQLSFNTQYSGAFVNFSGKIEAIGENNKAAYYKINFPKEVEYHQRRNTYRIAISIKETIPVNLVNEDEVLIKAELRDISHGGICLRFNSMPHHSSIKSGDYIPTCLIQVDENRKILSSLNICHVETIEETGTIRVGAEFAQISKIDQRELEHLIASLERSIIQKIKRTDKNSLVN
jgi:c-di-GMP-binding flagellar brake protein YcgR